MGVELEIKINLLLSHLTIAENIVPESIDFLGLISGVCSLMFLILVFCFLQWAKLVERDLGGGVLLFLGICFFENWFCLSKAMSGYFSSPVKPTNLKDP